MFISLTEHEFKGRFWKDSVASENVRMQKLILNEIGILIHLVLAMFEIYFGIFCIVLDDEYTYQYHSMSASRAWSIF